MKNGAERAKNAAIYVIIGLIGVTAIAYATGTLAKLYSFKRRLFNKKD